MITEFKKECECVATATTNTVRMTTEGHKATFIFHPGPSCNECGKLWKRTSSTGETP
jgi:hypothetical protein